MKKTYIQPEIEVVIMKVQQLICTSGEFIVDGSGNLSVDPSENEGDFGDDNTINARNCYFDWEE